MPADSFWEAIHLANRFAHRRTVVKYFDRLSGVFEAGDIAYAYGSLSASYHDFLARRGYELTVPERARSRHHLARGRYCVVLDYLGAGTYVICYLTTFGRSRNYEDIRSPIGQLFGLPIGQFTKWPGVKHLQTDPPWNYQRNSYILGIPTIRRGLINPNYPSRLLPGELERVKSLIVERVEAFDAHHAEFRVKQSRYRFAPKLMIQNPAAYVPTGTASNGTSPTERYDDKNRRIRCWLQQPVVHNHVRWLSQNLRADIENHSLYLNSVISDRQPSLITLPKPFFAPSLRMGVDTIAQVIAGHSLSPSVQS